MKSTLAPIYETIDWLLLNIARVGSWFMIALVCITMYDVSTRYLGFAKFEGLNSTMVQESEYWAHTFLFSLLIGYGYTTQAHVRIDLIRDAVRPKLKYILELVGILVFLLPFALISLIYCYFYALKSYIDNEVSPSTIGLTNFWILKSALVVLFALLLLAAISQTLKCIDGLRGKLAPPEEARILGTTH